MVVNKGILSELTLVVVTYNRPTMVQRLVRYLCSQAPELLLVLVDHGDPESQESNAIALSSLSTAVRHLRLPEEMLLDEVLVRATDQLSTPYAAFCPDDDIPVIDGIFAALSMLSEDSDMVCAHGYILSLTETNTAMYFGPVEDYVPSYNNAEPLARLFSMMRRYQPLFWSFYRTEILVWVMHEVAAAKLSNSMFQEFFHAALVCSRGKIGRAPSISLWRRVTDSHVDRRRIHPFHQLIDNPSLLGANYKEFCDKLLPYYIEDVSRVTSDNAFVVSRVIDLVFVQFLVRHIDYGELDGKIREFLNDLDRDYFASLPTQQQADDTKNFMLIQSDDINTEYWINENLFMVATEVSDELSTGCHNNGRELIISIEMLIRAIKSAMEYRSGN